MDLPAKRRTWLQEPSTAELVRRAQEAVADSKATIAQTRQVIVECWQEWHRWRWLHEKRPCVDPEDAGAHQGDGERAEQD
jgi:hypothetical protein